MGPPYDHSTPGAPLKPGTGHFPALLALSSHHSVPRAPKRGTEIPPRDPDSGVQRAALKALLAAPDDRLAPVVLLTGCGRMRVRLPGMQGEMQCWGRFARSMGDRGSGRTSRLHTGLIPPWPLLFVSIPGLVGPGPLLQGILNDRLGVDAHLRGLGPEAKAHEAQRCLHDPLPGGFLLSIHRSFTYSLTRPGFSDGAPCATNPLIKQCPPSFQAQRALFYSG